MAPGRIQLGKMALVLLLAAGTLSSQAASLEVAHSHRGVPSHCCSVCHAGHLPLVETVRACGVLPPARLDWFVSPNKSGSERDPLVVLGYSRAPPSFVVL